MQYQSHILLLGKWSALISTLLMRHICVTNNVMFGSSTVIILAMDSANERQCYNLTSPFIGWAHSQNDHRCKSLPEPILTYCQWSNWSKTRNILSTLCILMAWHFSTKASVATVLSMHPYTHSCWWVDENRLQELNKNSVPMANAIAAPTNQALDSIWYVGSIQILNQALALASTDFFSYTVWCCYNTVNFIQNSYKRHTIVCPLGWGMRCLL